MTFQINGLNGKYDGIIADNSVRYGRNAVENNLNFMEAPLINAGENSAPILDFFPAKNADENNARRIDKFLKANDEYLKSLPPLEYEYRYMPEGKFDGKAVLSAAYEEIGEKELSVEEFENRYLINNETMTAEPLDINKDDRIDISEYAANILAADVLSKGSDDISNVDGTINSKGMNAVLEYTVKSNANAAVKLYTNLYNKYNLADAYKEFTADDNTIK